MMWAKRLGWLLLAIVCTSCAKERHVPLEPCRLDGLAEEVLCTRVEVPEDREKPSGRRISLRVAVVPASSGHAEPAPLFLLAGGPGQAATDLAPWVRTVFRRASRNRDVVLVDQRGTGGSSPLDCDGLEEILLQSEEGAAEVVRGCAHRIDADPRRYTSADAARDLDEVRARLGFETVNLWGGSYGTRTALVYMRDYPERVRSAVLDGAAPFSLRFPLHTARDGARALERLVEDCERSPECARAYPDLGRRIEDVRSSIGAASSLRGFLYSPVQASLLPWVVARASESDWAPFRALRAAVLEWSFDTMSLGTTLSVLCSEDVSRITADEACDVPEAVIWREACTGWPVEPVSLEHAQQPVAFEGPVLVLSGGLDPVTPPRWGEETIRTFPRGRHLVAENAGHNVTPFGCAPGLIAEFLDEGSGDSLDGSCLDDLSRPPFVTSLSGPEP